MPVAYGHRDVRMRGYVRVRGYVRLRGYVDQIVIGCGGDIIARHARCRDREDMVFDPIHYLPLPEQKTGALE